MTPLERVIAKLTEPGATFSRSELAMLMGTAQRWGYEVRTDEEQRPDPLSWSAGYMAGYRARCAEENAAYPPPKVFTMGRWCSRAEERRRAESGSGVG